MKSLCHKHESRDLEAENKIPKWTMDGTSLVISHSTTVSELYHLLSPLKIIQETPEHRSVVTCLTRPEKNDGNGNTEVHLETLGMASILVHKSNTMQTMQ